MTTVGDALVALRVLFTSTFIADDQLLVRLGNRGQLNAGQNLLMIGDATGTTTPESLGPQRTVEEEYDIACEISVTVQGSVQDQEAVTLRAIDLYQMAEHAVRAVPGQDLGIPEIMWAGVTGGWGFKEAKASETGGPISTAFSFNVHVRAMYRLT